MNKHTLLKVVNAFLALSAFAQALTGLVLFFHVRTPFGHLTAEIHEYNGITLIFLVIFHLVLNWNWVQKSYFSWRIQP